MGQEESALTRGSGEGGNCKPVTKGSRGKLLPAAVACALLLCPANLRVCVCMSTNVRLYVSVCVCVGVASASRYVHSSCHARYSIIL